MRGQIAAALCSAVLGFTAPSSFAIAQQTTTRACLQEWLAHKDSNQVKTATARGRVVQCFSGGALTQGTTAEAPPAAMARSRKATTNRDAYSSVKDLMEAIIDPSADVIWGVGTVVDQEGVRELGPKTPEEWLDLRRATVRIIEGANLLLMPGRAAAPPGSKSEVPGVELEPAEITALMRRKRKSFNALARALRGLGFEALRASESKNAAHLVEIGGRIQDVCESCHKTFWYPNEKPPR